VDLESWVPNVAELAMPAEFIVAADAGSPQLGEAAVLAVELKRSQAHPVRRSAAGSLPETWRCATKPSRS